MTKPTSPLFASNAEVTKGKRSSGQKILMFVLIIVVVILVFVIMAQNSERTIEEREKERRRTALLTDSSKLRDELVAASKRPTAAAEVVNSGPEQPQSPQIIVIQPAIQRRTQKVTELQKEEGRQFRELKQSSLNSKSVVEGFATAQAEQSSAKSDEAASVLAKMLAGGGGHGVELPPDIRAALAAMGAQENPQRNKLDFLTSDGAGRTPQDYSKNVRKAPLARLELKAGTVIPGLLLTGINSDLPGMVLGQVSENIYDTATGAWLLIPQGARLIGVYDSQITQGQKRVGIVWNRIVFSDGSSLNIAGAPGTDMAGYSGIKGKVDNHYSQLLMAGLFTSFFSAAVDIASDNKDSGSTGGTGNKKSAKDVLVETTGTTIANIGAKLAEKAMEIQPTIVIKPGNRFNVMVQEDVIFPEAWRESTTRVGGF